MTAERANPGGYPRVHRPGYAVGMNRMLGAILGLVVCSWMSGCTTEKPVGPLPSNPAPRGFLFRESPAGSVNPMRWAVYVPREYGEDRSRLWPCIVFLHGSGESGEDGQKQIIQGVGSAILWDAKTWPAIVIFPQKATQKAEWEDYDRSVMAALDEVRAMYRVDPDRILLTGLSQGGHGSWTIGAAHPDVWAAIAPICGYVSRPLKEAGDAQEADRIAAALDGIPVWAFHGEADDVVPPAQTRLMIAALYARRGERGAEVKASYFPGVNHGSWDRAYREEHLAQWLLAQRKHRP